MLTRMVNGKTVVLSAEEEAAVRAEWAANEIIVAKPKKEDVIAEAETIIAKLKALQ